eukprot:snap_masked-scaffold_57-processed-gene-0.25-mRNA-1 protein AED:1.00 eAED:1.00 QI:0/0/0/0/1/1/2/0/362
MLGGVMQEAKIIHKLFLFAPTSMAVSLLQQEILFNDRLTPENKTGYKEIYGKLLVIAEKQQEDYVERSNAQNRSALVCFCCNQPGHFKSECKNPWYCTICQRQGHSAYKCRFNNKMKNNYKNDNDKNNNSFANAFIGIFHGDFRILKIEEENSNDVLILDSDASYHVCGSKHAHLLCDFENLNIPKLVEAAGGMIYKSTCNGKFKSQLDNGLPIVLQDVYIFEKLNMFLVSMAYIYIYISQKNIANLFLLKYIKNTDNIEKTVSGPLIANTVAKEHKLSHLHSLFGHQGIENFRITLQYYGYQCTPSQLSNFKCKTCELNNIEHAIIKRKNAVGFPGITENFLLWTLLKHLLPIELVMWDLF